MTLPSSRRKIVSGLRFFLSHPLTKGLDLDDPRTTEARCEIVRTKGFLRRLYADWYRMICSHIPDGDGAVLELGSGAGHFREFAPHAIRSDVLLIRNVDLVADGCHLPFVSGSLKAIVMTDVFHHIPRPEAFLAEAERCLRPAGRVVMIEPWVSRWSRIVYRHLHHEPFLPEADSWNLPPTGPLSSENGALPWIVFVRDRDKLTQRFPQFAIEEISPMMPLRYLASGGISMRSLMPAFTYKIWQVLEAAVSASNDRLGMFALFCLTRL